MEEDDDDLYDPAEAVPVTQPLRDPQKQPDAQMNNANDGEEEEEEVEVEEDEDEFNIITEAPPEAPPTEAQHPRHASLRAESQRATSADSSAVPKSGASSATPKTEISTAVPVGTRPVSQKPGSEYPPVHASAIDVHANPLHPATGKPIMSTDMDADFPDDDKPWRRPGTDLTDYFNYGFDEFTWASYVLKQQELRKDVGDQKRQLDDMQNFLSMGLPPMPGAPQPGPVAPAASAPPPMPGMPGMPDMSPEMMQGMLTSMMAQGLDPSSMDPMSFMQHAQAMMGGQSGAGGGQQGQPGYGGQGVGHQSQMGYGGGYGGGRGRGRRW